MRKKEKNKMLKTNQKILYLILFLAFLAFIYIIRLFSLQIVDSKDYKTKGNNISMIGNEVKPVRGNIYDREGNPLAVSQRIESLYILPVTTSEKREEAQEKITNEEIFNTLNEEEIDTYTKIASLPVYEDEEINKISNILNIDPDNIYKLINDSKEGYIYDKLNNSQKSQLQMLDLGYLLYIPKADRYYPNGDILANTLGFVEDDGEANYGLEKYYDDILSGESGYREFFRAVAGTEIPYTKSQNIEAKDSSNIKTSIDSDLQKIIHQHLVDAMYKTKSMSVTAILSNPNNGEILAIESLPTFDSNNPRQVDSDIDKLFIQNMDKDINEYTVERWNNIAVSKQYEPGSTYKVVTSAIALESNPDIKDKIYEDNGYYELAPGVVIRSWRYWDPFGPQNLMKALENSSNPVFVQIAKDVGKTEYINYAKPFGFGELSGIDLPNEIKGTYPKDDTINNVDFGTLSYGHYLNVNAVQMSSILNSIVNGGEYYKPHIATEILDKNNKSIYRIDDNYQRKTISKATSNEINTYLANNALKYDFNTDKHIFGAKTGTSVKYKSESIFTDREDYTGILTSTFVTYPANNPQYTLYLTMDEPLSGNYASDTAIPIAKEIMYDILEQEIDTAVDINAEENYVEVPDLVGLTVEEADKVLKELKIELTSVDQLGRYHIISEQYPEKDNFIERNTSISIKVNSNIKVPNLVDKDINEVANLLELNYVKYKIEGDGEKVIEQSIRVDEIIDADQEIILQTRRENE